MKGKVLIVGIDFYDYNLSAERAFKNLGYDTKVFKYWGDDIKNIAEGVMYKLFFSSKNFFKVKQELSNARLLSLYNSYKPDIVFIIHGWYVFKKTLARFKKSVNVLWLMDAFDRYGYHPLIDNTDYNFFFEKTDIDRYHAKTGKNAFFLPLALDESVYYPREKMNKEVDVSFIGALFEKRVHMLRSVINEFPHLNIEVYGKPVFSGNNDLLKVIEKNPHIFKMTTISPAISNMLYNRSKICLNIHHEQSVYGVNQRFFEVPGSGAFQITDYNNYVNDNFAPSEMVCYNNETEMLEQISTYLMNEKKREEVAANGHKKVVEHHTFTNRIKTVLERIQ